MLEVRWHGRGGQGAKTAAGMVAEVAVGAGKYAQAAPEYGAEREGGGKQQVGVFQHLVGGCCLLSTTTSNNSFVTIHCKVALQGRFTELTSKCVTARRPQSFRKDTAGRCRLQRRI